MNESLMSIHRGLAAFYALVAAVLCGLNLAGDRPSGVDVIALVVVFVLPVALHLIALKGARSGRQWGTSCPDPLAF